MEFKKIIVEKMGHEEPIVFSKNHPIILYYDWLAKFLVKETSYGNMNKCPTYRFLFWGTIYLIFASPLLLVGKLAEVLILFPILKIFGVLDDYKYEIEDTSPNWRLLLIFFVTAFIAGVLTGIYKHFDNLLVFLEYSGLIVVYIISIPAFLLILIYVLLTQVIPWFTVLYIIIHVTITVVLAWIAFKLFLALLNSKIGNPVIKVGCKVREAGNKLSKKSFETIEKIKLPEIKVKKKRKIKKLNLPKFDMSIFSKILIPFKVLYEITSEVVSNHCPPIIITEEVIVEDIVTKINDRFYIGEFLIEDKVLEKFVNKKVRAELNAEVDEYAYYRKAEIIKLEKLND